MRRFASCMFSAILRRRPTTLIVSSLRGAARRGRTRCRRCRADRRRGRRGGCGRWRSSPGQGRCRDRGRAGATAGEARTCARRFLLGDLGLTAAAAGARQAWPLGRFFLGLGDRNLLRLLGRRLRPRRRRAGARPRCPSTGSAARSAPSVSITASTEPIGIWSPTSPASSITLPATGLSISTVALSVIMSAICWSSPIVSPTLTCQATISASAMPSPMSGSLNS